MVTLWLSQLQIVCLHPKVGEGAAPSMPVVFVRRIKTFSEASGTVLLNFQLAKIMLEAEKASRLYTERGKGEKWL